MALATIPNYPHWDEDDWRAESACRGEETDLFFPAGVTGPAELQIAMAKAVCRRCPVQSPCLEFALTTNQQYGVWGGLTEDERRVVRRRRRATARAAIRAS